MAVQRRCFIVLVLALACLFVAGFMAAQNQDVPAMYLHVSGEDQPSGLMQTVFTLGPGITKAVRMYSEPSHTLVGLIVDSDAMPNPSETRWWQNNIGAEPLPPRTGIARVVLREGLKVALQTSARPQTDNHLDIYVYGVWPAGDERDGLFGHFYVPRTFDFALAKPPASAAHIRPLDTLICGSGSGCDGGSTNCKPNDVHSCCLMTTQDCGNCGKVYALCGYCPYC